MSRTIAALLAGRAPSVWARASARLAACLTWVRRGDTWAAALDDLTRTRLSDQPLFGRVLAEIVGVAAMPAEDVPPLARLGRSQAAGQPSELTRRPAPDQAGRVQAPPQQARAQPFPGLHATPKPIDLPRQADALLLQRLVQAARDGPSSAPREPASSRATDRAGRRAGAQLGRGAWGSRPVAQLDLAMRDGARATQGDRAQQRLQGAPEVGQRSRQALFARVEQALSRAANGAPGVTEALLSQAPRRDNSGPAVTAPTLAETLARQWSSGLSGPRLPREILEALTEQEANDRPSRNRSQVYPTPQSVPVTRPAEGTFPTALAEQRAGEPRSADAGSAIAGLLGAATARPTTEGAPLVAGADQALRLTNGGAAAGHVAVPGAEVRLPALLPPQEPGAAPIPLAATIAGQGALLESILADDDLDLLAAKIKRILDDEARRHGIDV